MSTTKDDEHLALELESELTARYGVMMANNDLRQTLGYASADAFRQALSRKTVPVPVFSIPNRRGKFALTKEVATWLAEQRSLATNHLITSIEPTSGTTEGGAV